MDRIENDASNNSPIVACVLVAAVTFVLSRCLATIERYPYRHTD
jgi:FlaG/FlaF family flagellin (archaellin)